MEKGETFHDFNFGNPIFDHQQGSFLHSSSSKYLQNVGKRLFFMILYPFCNPFSDHQLANWIKQYCNNYSGLIFGCQRNSWITNFRLSFNHSVLKTLMSLLHPYHHPHYPYLSLCPQPLPLHHPHHYSEHQPYHHLKVFIFWYREF